MPKVKPLYKKDYKELLEILRGLPEDSSAVKFVSVLLNLRPNTIEADLRKLQLEDLRKKVDFKAMKIAGRLAKNGGSNDG